jgi:betaine reductase
MATITTISQSVGANRIVPTVAIPYPVGNPKLEEEKESEMRQTLVKNAVDTLGKEVTEPPLIYSKN